MNETEFNNSIQRAIDCFTEYRQTGRLHDYGNPTYDILFRAGIITINKERRDQIREQTRTDMLAQATCNLMLANSKYDKLVAQQYLSMLESGGEKANKLITIEAKRTALKQFFDNLIAAKCEITTLIDSILMKN